MEWHRRAWVVVILFTIYGLVACHHSQPSITQTKSEQQTPEALTVPQLVPAKRLNELKKKLPKVAWPRLAEVLRSETTLWYDRYGMTPMYQDNMGEEKSRGGGSPRGLRKNKDGARLIVQEARQLFSKDGKTFAFPFGHTAGMDEADNAFVLNFLSLPVKEGRFLPITYWTESAYDVWTWMWIYPVGTLIGEVVYVRSKENKHWLVSEIRTRERHYGGWAVNSFRPFLTPQDLANAIEAADPNWAQDKKERILSELRGEGNLTAFSKESTAYPGIFKQQGYLDQLPEFADPEFLVELVSGRTYVSAYGRAWRQNGGKKSFAPTTNEGFSLVPKDSFAGLIEVNERSCSRCHVHANVALGSFNPRALIYGNVWGMDQIFSFHIYDESTYNPMEITGPENRRVNPLLAKHGLVEKWNKDKHSKDFYTNLPVPYKNRKNPFQL